MFRRKVLDPVCGMKVDPKTATLQSQHGGKTHYFCAPACKELFDREPQKYAAGAGKGCHCH